MWSGLAPYDRACTPLKGMPTAWKTVAKFQMCVPLLRLIGRMATCCGSRLCPRGHICSPLTTRLRWAEGASQGARNSVQRGSAMNSSPTETEYLGDGLYIAFDGYQLRLMANSHETPNRYGLLGSVCLAQSRYAHRPPGTLSSPGEGAAMSERYAIECGACGSLSWYDNDEEVEIMTECWRCGEIINSDL